MNVKETGLAGLKLIEPRYFRDERGYFLETFAAPRYRDAGIADDFVQENHSLSADVGTLRGLHFQVPPRAQGKFLRVSKGAVFDVAVDIRVGSPTFGQHASAILSAENWMQIWIPAGFAHGFCTLEPDTEVIYKMTDYYAPECERGIRWNDAVLGISWPIDPDRIRLSDRDGKQTVTTFRR